MFSIEEVVNALKITRQEFATIFLQVQGSQPPTARIAFEAFVAPTDEKAYQKALEYAQAQGWLDAIVDAIILGGFENGKLTKQRLDQSANPVKASLEAMTNLPAGFIEPDVLGRGVVQAMKSTAKICLNGTPRGTGVLISPNLVLTAWHVVAPLFAQQNDTWELVVPPLHTIEVQFDNVLTWLGSGPLRPAVPATFRSHASWLIAHSRCHALELQGRVPTNLSELDGYWDYAIIKLERPLLRRWVPLDAQASVPGPQQFIFLFQHPAGQPQKAAASVVAVPNGGAATTIRDKRFLHLNNSLQGSSGGPCFDKGFALVGIHQGKWMGPEATETTNCGIPISKIVDHIKKHIGTLPEIPPEDRRAWSLGPAQNHEPVIGCDEFQQALWQTAITGQRKMLLITGQNQTGKTFRVRLLKTLLADDGHLKIELDAGSIGNLATLPLAALLCQQAGTTLPTLQPPDGPSSTRIVWLRDEVLKGVMDRLEEIRKGRLVWLLITELNKSDIREQASELLLLIYEQLRSRPWLRVVLDGMRGNLPASLESLIERQRTRELQKLEVFTCLKQTLEAYQLVDVKDADIEVHVRQLMRTYERALGQGSADAILTLQQQVAELIGDYLAVQAQA